MSSASTGLMIPKCQFSFSSSFGKISRLKRSIRLLCSPCFCWPRNQNPKGKSGSFLSNLIHIIVISIYLTENVCTHPSSRGLIEDWRQTTRRDSSVTKDKDFILVGNIVWVLAFYTILHQIYGDKESRGLLINLPAH